MIAADWHGTWRPIEMFIYDDFSRIVGPACELVAFEQRCGKMYKATRSGMRAAAKHEAACSICQTYKGGNA